MPGKPAARVSDPTTHGAPLAPGPGSTTVLIANLPAWRAIIDQHACPAVSISGADGVGNVLMGSPTVFIENQMACRQGDIVVEKPGLAMGPMNPIAMGCPTVLIGEGGGGGGGGAGGVGGAGAGPSTAPVAPPPPTQVGPLQPQSGPPKSKTWIGIELRDLDGRPIPNRSFRVRLDSGQVLSGKTNAQGFTRFDGVEPDSGQVTFLDVPEDETGTRSAQPDTDAGPPASQAQTDGPQAQRPAIPQAVVENVPGGVSRLADLDSDSDDEDEDYGDEDDEDEDTVT